MTLRIFKRVPLIPGLRANISKSGVSLSIGHRGAWYTIGPRGRRATLGIPGSGVYWTERAPPARPVHAGHQLLFVLLVVLAIALLMR